VLSERRQLHAFDNTLQSRGIDVAPPLESNAIDDQRSSAIGHQAGFRTAGQQDSGTAESQNRKRANDRETGVDFHVDTPTRTRAPSEASRSDRSNPVRAQRSRS
jgi:hypothetical protein